MTFRCADFSLSFSLVTSFRDKNQPPTGLGNPRCYFVVRQRPVLTGSRVITGTLGHLNGSQLIAVSGLI